MVASAADRMPRRSPRSLRDVALLQTLARWTCVAALGLAAATSARPGAAQEAGGAAPATDEATTAAARELFQRGAALAGEGRWRDALAAFEQSALLKSHATTTYNLGYCERAIGHTTRALALFARALEEDAARGGRELSGALRAATRGFLHELEAEVAVAVVELDPSNAAVTVDGRPLEVIARAGALPLLASGTREPGPGEAPPSPRFELRVDPGSHVFLIAAPDGRVRVFERRFAAGSRDAVQLSLEGYGAPEPSPSTGSGRPPTSAATRPKPPAAVPDVAAPGLGTRGIATIGLGGVGAIGIAAGVVLAVGAASSWSDAKDACPGLSACPDDRGFELSHEADREANLATAAFVAGGAALVGAAVLLVTAPRSGRARRDPAAAAAWRGGGFVRVSF